MSPAARTLRTAIVFLFAAALAACGGGSSSSGPVRPSDAEKFCAFQISCPGAQFFGGVNGGQCVEQVELSAAVGYEALFFGGTDLHHDVQCAGSATDCTSLLNCESRGHGPAYCAAHVGESCDGDMRVICPSATSWGIPNEDCAAYGLRCQSANGHTVCTNGMTCTTGARCDGSHLIACDPNTNLETSIDCNSFYQGGTCETVTSSGLTGVTCVSSGPACSGSASRCDGTAAVLCSNGHEIRVDCAATVQGHCVLAGSDVQCVSDATECAASAPDRCVNGALQICVNGMYQTTNCSSIGFQTCGANANTGRTSCSN